MVALKKIEAFENSLRERAKHTNRFHYSEFLANRELIQAYLNKGFTAKAIWEALTEKKVIGFKYATFNNYVRKHRLKALKPWSTAEAIMANTPSDRLSGSNKTVSANQGNQPEAAVTLNLPNGMSHNPRINPKDLI